jgi:hypothetical protein
MIRNALALLREALKAIASLALLCVIYRVYEFSPVLFAVGAIGFLAIGLFTGWKINKEFDERLRKQQECRREDLLRRKGRRQ